ncbi:hypothetical protein PLICRDRAFT_42925 [Plicaturopsis crispa FD-325 SS-3]|nr:hypothetical protein PLICRDRAFT_42925 [Plicaturopsis crispa FD-325 SS-3]
MKELCEHDARGDTHEQRAAFIGEKVRHSSVPTQQSVRGYSREDCMGSSKSLGIRRRG